MPTTNTALRRSLDLRFDSQGHQQSIVGEIEDVAVLQVMGGHGMGLFAAPTNVEAEICRQYQVEAVGPLPQVHERFYAITVEPQAQAPGRRSHRASAREAADLKKVAAELVLCHRLAFGSDATSSASTRNLQAGDNDAPTVRVAPSLKSMPEQPAVSADVSTRRVAPNHSAVVANTGKMESLR